MKKDKYVQAELEIIRFTTADVLTTTGGGEEPTKNYDLPYIPS